MKHLFFTLSIICFSLACFAQNVGIGTTTPTYPLTVAADANSKGIVQKNGTVEIGFWTNTSGAYVQTWTPHDLNFATNNGTSRLTIANSTGFLGINTSAPTAQLDVNGTFRLRGNGAAAGYVLTTDANGNATWQANANGLVLPYAGSGSSTTAHTFKVQNTGTGLSAGYFENTGTSNNFYALQGLSRATNGGGVGVYGTAVAGASTTSFGIRGSVTGSNTAGYGVYGEATAADGVGGVTNTGTGVSGLAYASGGLGGYFAGFSGADALKTYGSVQLTGIGESAGKVLTSDASGNATWQTNGIVKSAFSALANNTLTISYGNTAIVPIDNESAGNYQFDDGGNFNTATHAYVAPASGVYTFTVSVSTNAGTATSDGYINVSTLVNGFYKNTPSLQLQTFAGKPLPGVGTLNVVVKLTAGDAVTIQVYNATGGSITISNGPDTHFSGYRLY